MAYAYGSRRRSLRWWDMPCSPSRDSLRLIISVDRCVPATDCWSCWRVKWRHSNLYIVGATRRTVKLSGEDLSRYSNKIITRIILRKWRHNNKHFPELAPRHGGNNIFHRYGMKKLCYCHPMYWRSRTLRCQKQDEIYAWRPSLEALYSDSSVSEAVMNGALSRGSMLK